MRIGQTLLFLLVCIPAARGDDKALIEKLGSDDDTTALHAAESLDPRHLTLGEIRRQAAVLSRHPERATP